MGIFLIAAGAAFWLLAVLIFLGASAARDMFSTSFALQMAVIGTIFLSGGAVVQAIGKLRKTE